MKHLGMLLAIMGLLVTMLRPAWAAVKLNSSKSNIYRLTYPADLLSRTQASALLAAIDRLGRTDDAPLRQWLAANLRESIGAAAADRIKKIAILLPGRTREQTHRVVDATTWILLLTDPADEAEAIAFTVQAIQREQASSENERRESEGTGGEGMAGGY